MAVSSGKSGSDSPRRPPATTPQARENQMVALAFDLAEQQLRDGSASSQVLTHWLKLGGERNAQELEKLRAENELLRAKAEQLKSASRGEELYENAIRAMRMYSGNPDMGDDEE